VRARRKRKNNKGVLVVVFILLFVAGFIFVMKRNEVHITADSVNVSILIGESVKPEEFIENIEASYDIISIEFIDEPNVLAHSNQNVQIRITDERENSVVVNSKLIIETNKSPPVIDGTDTINSLVGDPIMYYQGVSAYDDFGRDLTDKIQIDNSYVNYNETGEYEVLYHVTDLTGLKAEITKTVHVMSIDTQYVLEKVDETLKSIISDDMTQLEKVKAIHTWVISNISYASSTNGGESVYEDAYRALRDRSGNCFNYYSISEVMLTRAGIPNMPISRIPGTPTRHRWSLINPDDLGWHHFDATPTRLQLGSQTAFFTDSQAKEFTNRFVDFNGTRDFFTYDPDLYPKIV